MKEFDYGLDYKTIDFTIEENRKLYRIGRGEQGVLLVRPYTNDICAHWKFKTPHDASIDILTKYKRYISSKPWAASNYLRDPSKKPAWLS